MNFPNHLGNCVLLKHFCKPNGKGWPDPPQGQAPQGAQAVLAGRGMWPPWLCTRMTGIRGAPRCRMCWWLRANPGEVAGPQPGRALTPAPGVLGKAAPRGGVAGAPPPPADPPTPSPGRPGDMRRRGQGALGCCSLCTCPGAAGGKGGGHPPSPPAPPSSPRREGAGLGWRGERRRSPAARGMEALQAEVPAEESDPLPDGRGGALAQRPGHRRGAHTGRSPALWAPR